MSDQAAGPAGAWTEVTEAPDSATRTWASAEVLAEVSASRPLAVPSGGRVLVVGDVHGSQPHLLRLVQRAAGEGLSTIVQLGDTFGTDTGRSLRVLDALGNACSRYGVTCLWLEGNHDRHVGFLDRLPTHLASGLRPCRPNVWHLPRGVSWEWGGCRWTAVGGAASVDAAVRTLGADWWFEEVTDAEVDRIIAAVGATEVLPTHDRPAWVEPALGQAPGGWWRDTPFSWSDADFHRSQTHQDRLDRLVTALRPRLHLHGHLHRRYDLVTDPFPWGADAGEWLVARADAGQHAGCALRPGLRPAAGHDGSRGGRAVMRVLLAGDTHGNTAHLDHLLRTATATGCGWVFVAGDFGFWEHTHDGRVFLDKVDRLAIRYGVDVAFCDGNHDNTALLLDQYTVRDGDGLVVVRDHIRYAPRGHRWTWGTSRLLAAGGAASLDKQWRLAREARQTARGTQAQLPSGHRTRAGAAGPHRHAVVPRRGAHRRRGRRHRR